MAEDRQRPQFGEYASPEQQAAAMGKRPIPPLRIQPEMPTPQRPTAADGTPLPPTPPNPADAVVDRRLPRHHPVDRIATFILLGLGLYSLVNAVPGYFAFGAALEQFAHELNVSYTAPVAATHAGYVLFAAQVVLFLITLRAVRAGCVRAGLPLIPLAGYVIFDAAAALTVLLMVPGFLTVLQSYAAAQQ